MTRKSSGKPRQLTRKEVRDLDLKISFLQGIVDRDPAYLDALQLLGDHYTQRGRYAESLRIDLQLSQLLPGNPLVFYNLACSYALNGECEESASALHNALRLGYTDFRWLARDPDLRPLRKHPAYRRIQDKIRKMKIRIT
jgi:tetratricopeptide (TPR) repeat protein